MCFYPKISIQFSNFEKHWGFSFFYFYFSSTVLLNGIPITFDETIAKTTLLAAICQSKHLIPLFFPSGNIFEYIAELDKQTWKETPAIPDL